MTKTDHQKSGNFLKTYATRLIVYYKSSRYLKYALRVLIVLVTAFIANLVAEIVLHNTTSDTSAPSGLQGQTQIGFDNINNTIFFQGSPWVYSRRFAGGMKVLHSSLLNHNIPDYQFVRVSKSERRYWWTPPFVGPHYSSGRPYFFIYAIPLKEGEPICITNAQGALDFFRDNKLQVRNQEEAERLRRLFLELSPSVRSMSRLHRQINSKEWHLSIQESSKQSSFIKVITNTKGQIQDAYFRSVTN